MTEAFKCDYCGKYHEGKGNGRLKLESVIYTHGNERRWTSRLSMDLCQECITEIKELLERG